MTVVVKAIIGLGTLAVGGTGTYLTYDYLNKKGNSATQTEDRAESRPQPNSGNGSERGQKESPRRDTGAQSTGDGVVELPS